MEPRNHGEEVMTSADTAISEEDSSIADILFSHEQEN
jgi:hypothetical protein